MKNCRILIIDDSPAMRLFIRRVINLSGFEVESCAEASNGLEALAHLETAPVDLIVCDVNMPIMNGEEFLAALQRQSEDGHLPAIIVVSTDSTNSRVDSMTKLGASRYIPKPFSPEVMRNALEASLSPPFRKNSDEN